jgi:hypothetical protein
MHIYEAFRHALRISRKYVFWGVGGGGPYANLHIIYMNPFPDTVHAGGNPTCVYYGDLYDSVVVVKSPV